MTAKALLRLEALQVLTHIEEMRRKEAAVAAFSFLTEELSKMSGPVVSFASTPLEINLWPVNKWLIKQRRLFLPKVEEGSLTIYEVQSTEELEKSSFGLREPSPSLCRRVYAEEIKLVLVPALFFDSRLHRLGYGKGYFDRFLSTVPESRKWGVGFKEQKIEKIPVDSFDIKVDKLLLF